MTGETSRGLTGEMLIGSKPYLGTGGEVRATNPATGQELEPRFGLATAADVDRAAQMADEAFDEFRLVSPAQRAHLLDAIADEITADTEQLTARAQLETGLPEGRVRGEIVRTTAQLHMFAQMLLDGLALGVRIDPADPSRQPLPRPDIRLQQVALGPVAVFGASNFPFAFSTAGGDTASALAAGCPVIVKIHNAHAGTGLLVGRAIARAVRAAGLPGGVFSALIGPGAEVGTQLVSHPLVKAVGFTGSRSGGTALTRIAQDRPEPIPVYAEMSSINPVVLLPTKLNVETAGSFVASLTLAAGQLCTNPGILFVPAGVDGDEFVAVVAGLIHEVQGQTMLTPGIFNAFASAVDEVANLSGVVKVAEGTSGSTRNAPAPAVLETSAHRFVEDAGMQTEMFGAASLVVRYDGFDNLTHAIRHLEGQLTASIHGDPRLEHVEISRLLSILDRKAGRVILNAWPTGVEVTPAMVHGGPFPATSDGRSTSVGTLSIARFQRPVAYQNIPEELLPAALQTANPWHQSRLVNGRNELP